MGEIPRDFDFELEEALNEQIDKCLIIDIE